MLPTVASLTAGATGFIGSYLQYVQKNSETLVSLTIEHFDIIVLAIAIAVPIGVVLGVLSRSTTGRRRSSSGCPAS